MAKDATASSGKRCWLPVDAGTSLLALDADATPGFPGEEASAREQTEVLRTELIELQARLYAESRQRLLVVLQAMDTGGKDGVIRKVFEGVNPTGVRVASFKVPTAPEMARDYLWRAHQQVPANGELVIFNRSHYEDVLVVRVHELVPEVRWRRRYEQIVAFEKLLADEGTTVLKFFLHISKDEQRRRFQDRLDDPEKHWKFSLGDLKERERWDDYMAAYEEAIDRSSSDEAPWYVIPADRKWYRDLVVCRILVAALESLDMAFPQPADLRDVVIP